MDGPWDWYAPKEGKAAVEAYLSAAGKDKELRKKLVEGLKAGSSLLQQFADEWIARKAGIDRITAAIEKIPDLPK